MSSENGGFVVWSMKRPKPFSTAICLKSITIVWASGRLRREPLPVVLGRLRAARAPWLPAAAAVASTATSSFAVPVAPRTSARRLIGALRVALDAHLRMRQNDAVDEREARPREVDDRESPSRPWQSRARPAPGARTARLLAQAVPRDARISSPLGPRWTSLRLSPLKKPNKRAANGKYDWYGSMGASRVESEICTLSGSRTAVPLPSVRPPPGIASASENVAGRVKGHASRRGLQGHVAEGQRGRG